MDIRRSEPELDAEGTCRFDDAVQVLPGLERCDGENVVALCSMTIRSEHRIDAIRNHANALGCDTRELDRLRLCELGHGHDRLRGSQHADEPCLPVEAVPARKGLGSAKDREVVHRDHCRSAPTCRPAEGRAVEDVEVARPPLQANRVPERIPRDAREPAGSTEGHELELETRPVTQRTQQTSNVPRSTSARLDERRRVYSDPHAAPSSKRATYPTASRGSG